MGWADDVIWWQVYPLGFTGAHPGGANGRTLRYLEPWLDYAIELGCSGLALGPVFESVSHGYDTIDHFRIDPRLGSQEDFDSLVTAAHDR
ncbi:MAG: alpha-amylase family glycosyl hydrolase, partial [Candidatus Nanopelagicales bacterium]|nr:alpha-amylase family glycosyl hydrolase [Candidatus Nanopelagicales bacterium]